jgi:hypothetical protein
MRTFLSTICCLLVLCSCARTFAPGAKSQPSVHLFAYDSKALLSLSRNFGFRGDQSSEIWTNQAGNKLFLQEQIGNWKGDIFVFSPGKGYPDIVARGNRTRLILDDEGRSAAWTDPNATLIRFADGRHLDLASFTGDSAILSCGAYFLAYHAPTRRVTVAALANSHIPLIDFVSDFRPTGIVVKGDRICLSGLSPDTQPSAKSEPYVCLVYTRLRSGFEKTDEIRLSGQAILLDPWTDNLIVCTESLPTIWHTTAYNLSTRQVTEIGSLPNQKLLFVQSDWIGDLTARKGRPIPLPAP